MQTPFRRILILGGTGEARMLAKAVAEAGLDARLSLAGRVAQPRAQALPVRIGGFGGADGLAAYLRTHQITHLIDATHPFAAQVSANAVVASARAGVPLIALTRPPWRAKSGDNWQHVPDLEAAATALAGLAAARVMLAVGRQHLARFAQAAQHWYLLRLVDPPAEPLPFPRHHVIVARGPFERAHDRDLMQRHRIARVVSKNAGGDGAYAKIAAARDLGLPVIMIERPQIPARHEAATAADVLAWLGHGLVPRGV